MQKEHISLKFGEALAIIRAESKNSSSCMSNLSKDDQAYVLSLKERANKIIDSKSDITKLTDELNKDGNNTLLTDFFLRLFLNDSNDKDCFTLAKAFNTKFHLFEEFNEVFKDFTTKYKELIK